MTKIFDFLEKIYKIPLYIIMTMYAIAVMYITYKNVDKTEFFVMMHNGKLFDEIYKTFEDVTENEYFNAKYVCFVIWLIIIRICLNF